ncbi:MAG: secondary thiamine-phosphate synthase enzyme YjbQ [Dehalococcoidales bacterium]|nr:secondary thiamine-phosphate synthase enzyme YjbQ [Dehalococcoidales bacterium]
MVVTREISLQTKGQTDIIDITSPVAEQVAGAGVKNGTVTLFLVGSTAGITTIESEPGVLSDFRSMWERTIPQTLPYEHNRHGESNGHAHVRASLLGASMVIPISDGKITLGTWQQIVLVDFDNRPRSRQIVVQIMGD